MLEFRLTENSSTTVALWMTAFLVISLVLCLVYLSQLIGKRFVSRILDSVGKLIIAVLASVLVFTWQMYFYRGTHDTVPFWCFATSAICGVLIWQFSDIVCGLYPKFERALPAALVLASLIEVAGFAHATSQFCNHVTLDTIQEPGVLIAKSSFFAKTDAGCDIELFERQMSDDEYQVYIENASLILGSLANKAMLRAKPYKQSNCHGWVFASGEHIVRGENVQAILDDNGYLEVKQPQSGDVIVYRSSLGVVLHTGLVRGKLEDAVMVESKWGLGALYLHLAEEQPYSQNFSYWRSARRKHSILIESRNEEAASTELAHTSG